MRNAPTVYAVRLSLFAYAIRLTRYASRDTPHAIRLTRYASRDTPYALRYTLTRCPGSPVHPAGLSTTIERIVVSAGTGTTSVSTGYQQPPRMMRAPRPAPAGRGRHTRTRSTYYARRTTQFDVCRPCLDRRPGNPYHVPRTTYYAPRTTSRAPLFKSFDAFGCCDGRCVRRDSGRAGPIVLETARRGRRHEGGTQYATPGIRRDVRHRRGRAAERTRPVRIARAGTPEPSGAQQRTFRGGASRRESSALADPSLPVRSTEPSAEAPAGASPPR